MIRRLARRWRCSNVDFLIHSSTASPQLRHLSISGFIPLFSAELKPVNISQNGAFVTTTFPATNEIIKLSLATIQKPSLRSKWSNDFASSHEFVSGLYFVRKEVCFRLPHLWSELPRSCQFRKCFSTHGSDSKAYISSPLLTNVFRKYRPSSQAGNCVWLLEYGLYVTCSKEWFR